MLSRRFTWIIKMYCLIVKSPVPIWFRGVFHKAKQVKRTAFYWNCCICQQDNKTEHNHTQLIHILGKGSAACVDHRHQKSWCILVEFCCLNSACWHIMVEGVVHFGIILHRARAGACRKLAPILNISFWVGKCCVLTLSPLKWLIREQLCSHLEFIEQK